MNKKDIKVEILRIIACFAVIAYHTRNMPVRLDGTVSESSVFIECMCSICVASFFLISGFYIYNKKGKWYETWIKTIISFIKTLIIPVAIFAFICIGFDDYIFNRCSIKGCIENYDIKYVLKTLWDGFYYRNEYYWPSSIAHFWYVFEYMKIIIYYPITKLIVNKLDKKLIYALVGLILLYQLYVDISIFNGEWAPNKLFLYIPRSVVYSVIGYLLYNDVLKKVRESGKSNLMLVMVGVLMYVVSFVGLYFLQCNYLVKENATHTFTSWYSVGAITLSTGLAIIIYNINFDKLNEKVKNIIYYVASATLGIFIIHLPIVLRLITCGFAGQINKGVDGPLSSKILYLVFYNLGIFVVSLIIVIIIRQIKNIFLSIGRMIKH